MTKTLVPRIQTFRDQLGFTLLEILVVIGLIALVMAAAIPSLGVGLKVNINTSARELATTIRSVYDEAALTGTVYRLAIDVEKGEYWAEVGTKDFLLLSAEKELEEKKRESQRTEEEKKKRKKSPFSLASRVTKNKKKLPRGVHFTDVQTTHAKEPQTKGIAYAHVFPHGFMEKLVLHLKDDFDREATLISNPVTGKSRLFQRYVKEID